MGGTPAFLAAALQSLPPSSRGLLSVCMWLLFYLLLGHFLLHSGPTSVTEDDPISRSLTIISAKTLFKNEVIFTVFRAQDRNISVGLWLSVSVGGGIPVTDTKKLWVGFRLGYIPRLQIWSPNWPRVSGN